MLIYYDEVTGVNYLEVAPVGWGNGITVNQGGLTGETTGDATFDPFMKWCSDLVNLLGLNAWSNSAIGTGTSNTATADTTCSAGAIQAAADYSGGSKTDWFLPSIGETSTMYQNLRALGLGGFRRLTYWSSSEGSTTGVFTQGFFSNTVTSSLKDSIYGVRPIRSF